MTSIRCGHLATVIVALALVACDDVLLPTGPEPVAPQFSHAGTVPATLVHSQTRRASAAASVQVFSSPLEWTTPEQASGLDGLYAHVTTFTFHHGLTHRLELSELGFEVPASARILGIEVTIVGHGLKARIGPVVLLKPDGTESADRTLWARWPTSDASKVFGGQGDQWGLSWRADDLNDPEFAITLHSELEDPQEANPDGTRAPAVHSFTKVDDVQVTVFYTASGQQTRSPATRGNRNTSDGVHSWTRLPGSDGSWHVYFADFFDWTTQATKALRLRNFGFQIPADAQIIGVTAEVHRGQTQGFPALREPVKDHLVQLRLGVTTQVGANRSRGDTWPVFASGPFCLFGGRCIPDELHDLPPGVYGGDHDLWGLNLTPDNLPLLELWIAAKGATWDLLGGSRVGYVGDVDGDVRVTIHYLFPAHDDSPPENAAPVADAGPDQQVVLAGASVAVTLDGSASSDADGDQLVYTWTGDFEGGVASGVTPTVEFNTDDTHLVLLEVSDGTATASSTMTVTVTLPAFDPPGQIADETPPVIAATVSPSEPDGANGWYHSNVSVTWAVSDPESAIALIEGCVDQAITEDTQGVTFTCAVASSGGESRASVTIKRDATDPMVVPSRTPTANAAGWNNTDITVTPNGTDATSGVAGCTSAQVSTEGMNQEAVVSCTDLAGNVGFATLGNINIDKRAPDITGNRTPAANGFGWNNGDVTVFWTCRDPGLSIPGSPLGESGSGVATVTPSQDLTSEGAGQSRTGTCSDHAGNTVTATVGDINIDRTAPTLAGSRTPAANAFGWTNQDVSVAWVCTDALSGAATVTEGQIVTAEGVNQSRDGACTDRAGNSVAGTVSGISIDKRAPDITGNRTPAANAFGWNNGDVMVFWTCRDPGLSIPGSPLGESGSGVATVTASEDLTTEGAGQSRTGTCTDRAGNMATATVSDINVDRSVPTITFTGNAGSYTVDQTVAIACGASDALSGIDPARTSCPGAQGPAYGFALGSNTIQATATDLADNATAGSTTFTVEVTYQGLGSLVDRFVADGGVANSLTTKLRAAESARNANARAGQLGAFVNQLNALRGRQLSAEHADLLIALSRGL